jgi:serine/threonine protein kinase
MAHRDLKPKNILVKSRYPLFIKLADFGLANDKRDLKTFCGSQGYAAPEIYFRNRYNKYTTAVDL